MTAMHRSPTWWEKIDNKRYMYTWLPPFIEPHPIRVQDTKSSQFTTHHPILYVYIHYPPPLLGTNPQCQGIIDASAGTGTACDVPISRVGIGLPLRNDSRQGLFATQIFTFSGTEIRQYLYIIKKRHTHIYAGIQTANLLPP